MKIIFTGAQGTGKTTVLKYYKKSGYKCITNVVRNLSKKGVKINETGDSESQKIIFDTYYKKLNKAQEYVSDRGLTDVYAYSLYLLTQAFNKKNEEEFQNLQKECKREAELLRTFVDNNKDIIWVRFPIEFPIENDGVRSENDIFRELVDDHIKHILDGYEIPYITVKGTVEERITFINEKISAID